MNTRDGTKEHTRRVVLALEKLADECTDDLDITIRAVQLYCNDAVQACHYEDLAPKLEKEAARIAKKSNRLAQVRLQLRQAQKQLDEIKHQENFAKA